MTRGGDGLSPMMEQALLHVRSELRMYLEDVDAGWYDTLTKDDFVMRIRMALDDLDESELGAMYDQYVSTPSDSSRGTD